MKYQATRNGQYIGEPKKDRPAAQQIVCDDMEFSKKAYEAGWITKKQFETNRWYVLKVRS